MCKREASIECCVDVCVCVEEGCWEEDESGGVVGGCRREGREEYGGECTKWIGSIFSCIERHCRAERC